MPELHGLIVDWGGVLTSALQDCMRAWCETDGIDYDRFRSVMRDWLAEHADEGNPAHGLERGELEAGQFERELAARLVTHDGTPVPADGLLQRMFAGFDADHGMVGAVRRAKLAGIRTALCSNSWGNEYPRQGWDELFDAVVISGEVGMRKPEERIYRHTAALLGLAPESCVFVDDLPVNVRAAVAVGMVGVRHVTSGETIGELETLFGVPLSEVGAAEGR